MLYQDIRRLATVFGVALFGVAVAAAALRAW